MLLYSFKSCLQRAENFTPTNFNKVFKFVNLSLFGMKSFSSISNFKVIYEAIKTAIKSEKIPSIGKKTCGIQTNREVKTTRVGQVPTALKKHKHAHK